MKDCFFFPTNLGAKCIRYLEEQGMIVIWCDIWRGGGGGGGEEGEGRGGGGEEEEEEEEEDEEEEGTCSFQHRNHFHFPLRLIIHNDTLLQ